MRDDALLDSSPLSLLFDVSASPPLPLPEALERAYGGPLRLARGSVFANFVSSVDGVVALDAEGESGGIISGGNEADRFVMGLLRACADTIIVGAGTFCKAGRDRFDAESIFPAASAEWRQLRQAMGLPLCPRLVVVTASGGVDVTTPALEDALVVTTSVGATRLRHHVPSTTTVAALGDGPLDMRDVLTLVRSEGGSSLLTEGGPSLFTELVSQGLVQTLFLTLAPSLHGRREGDGRKSLIHGSTLGGLPLSLESLRRSGSFLFACYGVSSHQCVVDDE